MVPKFFATPAEWRAWLERHHAQSEEILVGFYKRGSGKPSITWPEAVDAALCFGWIDGVRRKIDDASYSIRFTPRTKTSIWSAANTKRVQELSNLGLMNPAGIKAFEARQAARSGIYSFEQEHIEFDPAHTHAFRANTRAWKFFQSQPLWYQRAATWWVVSAKRPETKARRLATLIDDSAREKTLSHLTRRA